MMAWIDFECGACGILLTPNFEITRVVCAGGCGEELFVCLSCGRKKGGSRCTSCHDKWVAKEEAREEARLDAELEAKLAAGIKPSFELDPRWRAIKSGP